MVPSKIRSRVYYELFYTHKKGRKAEPQEAHVEIWKP
jgi:hypothetical protein